MYFKGKKKGEGKKGVLTLLYFKNIYYNKNINKREQKGQDEFDTLITMHHTLDMRSEFSFDVFSLGFEFEPE